MGASSAYRPVHRPESSVRIASVSSGQASTAQARATTVGSSSSSKSAASPATTTTNSAAEEAQTARPGAAEFPIPSRSVSNPDLVPPGANQTVANRSEPGSYRFSDTPTFTRDVDILPEGHRLVNGDAKARRAATPASTDSPSRASGAKLVARPRASTTAAAEDRGRLRGSRA
jgi:hypothetical protein